MRRGRAASPPKPSRGGTPSDGPVAPSEPEGDSDPNVLQVDEGEAAAAEPVAEDEPAAAGEPAENAAAEDADGSEPQEQSAEAGVPLEATAVSDKLTDGWTQYGDTCEYKVDDAGGVTLRPLGGESSAELTSLSGWSGLKPTSFKIEGTIKLVKKYDYLEPLSSAFSYCSKLATVDLSGLVTDGAVDCSGLFYNCSSLTSVKLPTTFKVSDASSMFRDCPKLPSADLSGLETPEAVDCGYMFYNCSSLASVKLPAALRASSLSHDGAGGMFSGCSKLASADLSGLVTDEAVSASGLFSGCKLLESVTMPETFRVSSASSMFSGCSKLASADLSGLVTDEAVSASGLFSGCLLLESVTMPETFRVSSASSMFSSCSSLKSIDTTGLDTSAATSLSSMFSGCSKLASLDVSGIDTSSVTNMETMFSSCAALASLDLSGFDTSSVTDMSYMFSGCSKLAFLDVSGFDTSKVTDFCDMFQSCEKLESLDLSSFDTSNALYISYMFGGSFPTTIKLGDKFTFNGAYSERKLDFPTVNSWPSIYTGKWISSADGKVYAANEIPNNVAATYTAQKAVTAQLFTVDTADEVCSGAPITKKVTSEKLVEGRDYEVVYANNTAPGKATIAINGVGDLGGSVEYNFDIYPANYTWSTSDGAQDISTTINYKAKVEWKSSNDSVVTIGEASTSTTELGPIVSQKCSVKVTPKAVGTAFVYAYANGMQVAKVAVQVVAGAGKSIAGAQIGGVPASCTYNGEKVEPKVTVTLDGKKLTEGVDYTVSYGANTDAGTGSVTVTGTGGYTGSASASFTIKQAGISGAKVSAADQAWTGKALTPAPTVVWNGRTLAENTDYTVSYASNVNAGTATVTVTGKGNFAGTATGTFKITKPEPGKTDISGAEVTAAAQAYTGSALTPAVTVTLGGKALSAGTDYTVAYSSNVNAGTATVTVTGKGNYTGVATGTFKIAAADASKASVKAADQAWTGKALTPAPTVTLNGKTLKQGTDYTATYANNVNAGNATVTVTFKGNYSGTAKGTFKIAAIDASKASVKAADQAWTGKALTPAPTVTLNGKTLSAGTDYTVSYSSNVDAGTATVTVTFKGNYAGEATGTFKIAKRGFAFADVGSSTAHAEDIQWLADEGISAGWSGSDGTRTFRPFSNVLRADMAAFLYRMAGSPDYAVSGRPFADCDSSTAHYKEVCWLASAGVSQGWTEADGSKTFRPYTTVARADMAAFLHRMRDKGLV